MLGAMDGLTALISAPEVAPGIMGIVLGSMGKGTQYFREILIPGSMDGLIVGFLTQRYGVRTVTA